MPLKSLFVGLSVSPPSWYRCGLPSIYLGEDSDWIGYVGTPKAGGITGGRLESSKMGLPDTDPYDVIVVQQVWGDEWLETISEWQAQGKKVIYEIDDFVHGIWKIKNHTFRKSFSKKRVKLYSEAMKICDAVITSTDRLAEYYKKNNSNIHTCKNAIDTRRYKVKFPERDWITIGWAGGTGHDHAIRSWIDSIALVMERHPNVAFCSIGTDYAGFLAYYFPERCLSVPWVSLENLPYALTNFDICIAPAHESKYHLAKSDLRWLEAGAVGLPVIADKRIYDDVEDAVTGVLVDGSKDDITGQVEDELEVLLYDENERKEIGKNAQAYIQDKRDIQKAAGQWHDVISSVVK
jgi:glycosyltransferase involved in cell wall biosynthesis